MDLVSDMLATHLPKASSDVEAAQLRPPMRRLFRSLPGARLARIAYNADRLYGRFVQYPHFLRDVRTKFDVFHVVDHTYAHLVHALPAQRTVVTCHDLDAFRPLFESGAERRSVLYRVMARRVLTGLQKAAFVA